MEPRMVTCEVVKQMLEGPLGERSRLRVAARYAARPSAAAAARSDFLANLSATPRQARLSGPPLGSLSMHKPPLAFRPVRSRLDGGGRRPRRRELGGRRSHGLHAALTTAAGACGGPPLFVTETPLPMPRRLPQDFVDGHIPGAVNWVVSALRVAARNRSNTRGLKKAAAPAQQPTQAKTPSRNPSPSHHRPTPQIG
jgi:hypothetical protein